MFCSSQIKPKIDIFEDALNQAIHKNGYELYLNSQKNKVLAKSKLGSYQNLIAKNKCIHLNRNNTEDVISVIAIYRTIISEEILNHPKFALIERFNITIGNLCKWGHINCYYLLTTRSIFQKHGTIERTAVHHEMDEILNSYEVQLKFKNSEEFHESQFYFLVDTIQNFASSFVLFKSLSDREARTLPVPSASMDTLLKLEILDSDISRFRSIFDNKASNTCPFLSNFAEIMECRSKLNFYENNIFNPPSLSKKLTELVNKMHNLLAFQIMIFDLRDFNKKVDEGYPNVIIEMISEYVGDFRTIQRLSPMAQEICASPFQRQTKITGFYDDNPQCIKLAYYQQARNILDFARKYDLFNPINYYTTPSNIELANSKSVDELIMDPYFIIGVFKDLTLLRSSMDFSNPNIIT